MQFTEDSIHCRYLIRKMADNEIWVNNQCLSDSFYLGANHPPTPINLTSLNDVDAETLSLLQGLNAELLIIGCGQAQQLPSPSVHQALIQSKLPFEIMTNAAACRTYNLLANDGRKVVLVVIF